MKKVENVLEKEEKLEIIKIEKEKKNNNKRELLWDIVKGIGIISIVLGHVTANAIVHEFVYIYHLAIFYFASAYFYNEKKYGDKPFEYFGQRLKTTWTKYLFYAIILILFHNLFIRYHFYSPTTEVYKNFDNIIVPILNSVTFQCPELFAGALWFVATILIALGLFSGVIYISRKATKFISTQLHIKNEKIEKYVKYAFILIITILYGWLGVYINVNQLSLLYHAHTSFLVIPICTMAYFLRKNENIIDKIKKLYINIPIFIISTAIILYMIIKMDIKIELASEVIAEGGLMFYIVSTIGICFCISLASIIEKIPLLNKFIALTGKHSFSIMALHFACVKGVDVIYSKIIGEVNPEIISRWVTTYPKKLWFIYLVVGCIAPLIFSIVLDWIKKLLKNKLEISEEK